MLLSTTSSSPPSIGKEDDKDAQKEKMAIIIDRYKDRISNLPKHKSWINCDMYKYQGFWYHQGLWLHSNASFSLEMVLGLQDDFRAQSTDVLLASHLKSGTTWLKALVFAIVNRNKFKRNTSADLKHPLLNTSPHDCIPFIESESFLNNPCYADGLIATHIPYSLLPKSIISSGCRIVYICRDPRDVLVSFWHFVNKLRDDSSPPMKLEDAFELFSRGISPNGPFWDHVIEYRKASLENPDKVLFLKYEEMKIDAKNGVKNLAEFMGYPFKNDEEADGVVADIIDLCSFEKLREANKANKVGEVMSKDFSSEIFFRKGKVGDSANYLTQEMIQILDEITKEKYQGLDI